MTTVNICGYRFTINRSKEFHALTVKPGKWHQELFSYPKYLGRCGFNPKEEIWIAPELSGGAEGATILHEIIEAVDTFMRLKLRHDKITMLADGLYQILIDNPELILKLLKRQRIE